MLMFLQLSQFYGHAVPDSTQPSAISPKPQTQPCLTKMCLAACNTERLTSDPESSNIRNPCAYSAIRLRFFRNKKTMPKI